jgi:hypothetical protein
MPQKGRGGGGFVELQFTGKEAALGCSEVIKRTQTLQ